MDPLSSLRTLRALDALLALSALDTLLTLRSLKTLSTLRTLKTLRTLSALYALLTLSSLSTLDSLLALSALETLRTLSALDTLRTGELANINKSSYGACFGIDPKMPGVFCDPSITIDGNRIDKIKILNCGRGHRTPHANRVPLGSLDTLLAVCTLRALSALGTQCSLDALDTLYTLQRFTRGNRDGFCGDLSQLRDFSFDIGHGLGMCDSGIDLDLTLDDSGYRSRGAVDDFDIEQVAPGLHRPCLGGRKTDLNIAIGLGTLHVAGQCNSIDGGIGLSDLTSGSIPGQIEGQTIDAQNTYN